MKNHNIGASILSIPFLHFADAYKRIVEAGVDFIHLDIMDGNFVPNLSFSPSISNEIKNIMPHVPFDIHFMMTSLGYQQTIKAFLALQPVRVSIHAEAFPVLNEIMKPIKEMHIQFGVAINPATSVETILPWLHDLDFILLMSVNPGFGGQTFHPDVLDKARLLDSLRRKNQFRYLLEVDGGLHLSLIPALVECGIDLFVIGNDLVKQPEPREYIQSFRRLCQPVS